jgi:2',3'-cyclic-nucleotide 2'-phosphodiesterase (5'-nucleotidase family)
LIKSSRIQLLYFSIICLCACSPKLAVNVEQIKITKEQLADSSLTAFIAPFKQEMDAQMRLKIAESEHDFIVKRPSSNLMNWMADAVFINQTRNVRLSHPAFCLLNTGGIRSSIGKGDVLLNDLFKVMPFDNTIVWAKIPITSLEKISAYLIKSGGEPISNVKMKNGQLLLSGVGEKASINYFWVITSNYLFNGGDNMNFFQDAVETIETKTLIRDVLIQEAKFQEILLNDSKSRIE